MQVARPIHDLVLDALSGDSIEVSALTYSLHDLTQIAVALRTQATLSIRGTDGLTPLERASIATAARGKVVFL